MKSFIKYSLVVIGLSLAIIALRHHLTKIPELIGTVKVFPLAAAFLGLLIYQFWNAGVWSEVLAILGFKCKRLDAARVWIESESLKWLPGGVWSYGSRIVTAQRLGVNKKQASSSMILELLLTNVAWAALAVMICFSKPVMDKAWSLVNGRIVFVLLGLFLIGALVVLLRNKIMRSQVYAKILSIADLGEVDYGKCLKTIGHYILLCLWNVTMMWLVILAIPSLDIPFITVIGLGGVAWLVGFWAIGIPGGLGVREAVITFILSQYGSVESGVLMAVVWRAVQMLAEISSLVLSLAIGARMHLKKTQEMKQVILDERGDG
ncbi:MAG: lysylphosphatidylglycerol synthase transmembrane domain-containing protein [Akkermansiaceae bacterium]